MSEVTYFINGLAVVSACLAYLGIFVVIALSESYGKDPEMDKISRVVLMPFIGAWVLLILMVIFSKPIATATFVAVVLVLLFFGKVFFYLLENAEDWLRKISKIRDVIITKAKGESKRLKMAIFKESPHE
jgi:ABC-type branched-subunit amino acid transport system permease subunit